MGVRDDRNNRVPTVKPRTKEFHWEHNSRGSDESVGVTHIKDGAAVTIDFDGDKVSIPVRQVQWLAEVLLQVSDFYRQTYDVEGRDDYNRPDLDLGDRR